ncbi:MAG: hypothetical protein QXQ18_00155 [Candidatus Aenigmatarchaeota archaeon]
MYEKEKSHFRKEKKILIYEKLCSIFNNFPSIIPNYFKRKYDEAIIFSHIDVNSNSAFWLGITIPILILAIPSLILSLFNLLSPSIFLAFVFSAAYSSYYFLSFPLNYATEFRLKATSEMVLCVNYMVISLRISPNLENAIKFASENLKSALGYDLRMVLWNVYTGKYYSTQEGFDHFINKWKRENEEFAEALTLLKSAVFKTAEERERFLSNALRVIIDGSKTRIKKYSRELRAPIGAVNALGILLPALGLVLISVFAFFLPFKIPAISFVLVFNLIIPVIIYSLLNNILSKRPFSFPVPDITIHPKFKKEKTILKGIISLLPFIAFLSYSILSLSRLQKGDFLGELIYSLLIILGLAFSIILYVLLIHYPKLKLRNEIESIESEFPDALYQLSFQLEKGLPMESAIESILPRIKTLHVKNFLKKIRENILTLGLTFESAIFDKKLGAIYYFPSKLLESIMGMVASIMKKGLKEVSSSMRTVSKYLLDTQDVMENFRDILSESVAEMTIQKYLLFPIVSAVIIAIIAMIFQVFFILGNLSEKFIKGLEVPTDVGEIISEEIMFGFLNLSNVVPTYQIQLIVGFYLIEMIFILSSTQIIISRGDDVILKSVDLMKSLIVAMSIYSLASILFYIAFSGLASSVVTNLGQVG